MAKIKKIKLGTTTYDLCDADAVHTVKQDGVTGATVNRFGTCSTAAATAAKAVSITTGTFNLEAGAKVTVKFSNANTASTPTLNVNSKGAKNIFHKGSQITSGTNKALLAGTVEFVYDGTQWHLIGNYVNNSHAIISGTKKDGTTEIKGSATSSNPSLGDSGVTQGSYGPTQDTTTSQAGTFTVPEVYVNSKGIVTDATTRTITLPTETSVTIIDKKTSGTEKDTTDLVYAISNLVEGGTRGHEITPTYTGLPTKAYVDKVATGHVKYLGTVKALTELSTTAGQGDFYRVSTAFTFGSETAHVGDIILATKDNPAQNATDWDLIHTEVDSNTWTANTTTAAGYVAAPTTSNPNKVWRTNSSGSPGWRDPSTPEAFLTWGGKNFEGAYGPIDAAMISDLGANRLAFFPKSKVVLEYSTNSGSSWTTVENDTIKAGLFSTGESFYIGNSSSALLDKTAYMCRITITTSGACYSVLNKFAIYVSTGGSTGSYCTIEGRTKANQDSGTNTWATFANKVPVSGWSGWNIINISGITTHGNTSSQYSQLRFTFGVTSHPAAAIYAGLSVARIMAFGGVGWDTPSNMAKNGSIYSYDSNQNVTFPGNVSTATGKKFIGNLQGNADTATKVATTYESSAYTRYDLLAAPVNEDAYDSIYKNSNVWLKPNSADFTNVAGNKTFKGGPRVIIGDATMAASITSEWIDDSYYDDNNELVSDGHWETQFDSTHAGTGHLEVTGDLIVGGGSDSYGIFPARSNYSKIGDSTHYWFQIYAANIYQNGTKVINTITQDGITGARTSGEAIINRFGTCGTAAATAAKTVTITSGNVASLTTGLRVTVKFTYANTASYPTLNVNGKGAKSIYHKGSQITLGTNKSLLAGVCDFVYDGTQWHLVGNYIDTNTNTNYYHTTGSWSDLTYTATANGGAGALAFTLPTGTSATTVALGNHTHTASLATDTGTSAITLAYGGKYKLTAGGSNVIFTMPSSDNTWRGIQDNLTSTSTTDSLSANQGKVLKAAVDGKVTANTAITGATNCKITYDSKGLVTAGAALAASDIPNLAASKITSGTFDLARLPTVAAATANYDRPIIIGGSDSSTTISSHLYYAAASGKSITANPSTGRITASALTLTSTTDLSGTANNGPALIIGGAVTSTHMEIDCNEIQAKTNGTSTAQLYINTDGGCTNFGGGIKVSGTIVGDGNTNTGAVISGFSSVSAGSFTATSDQRLKENIRPWVCDKNILDLEVKKFDFINGLKDQIGCLAQDLQEICPELVKEDENGYLGIHETKLVYLLLQELKKQNKRLAELEAKL